MGVLDTFGLCHPSKSCHVLLASLCSGQFPRIPGNCVVKIEWAYVEVINVCKPLVLKQTVKVQPDTSMHKNVKTLGYIPQKDGKLS